MKAHKLLFLILVLILTSMTGCYDAAEVDDEVYALVIGADKGVTNIVRVTVQYPSYQDGGGGGKSEGGGGSGGEAGEIREVSGTIVVSASAPTILEAMNIINNSVPREISLKHVKMIVFSEDYAKDGIGDYLEPMSRFRETRRVTQVVVCEGSAEEFIQENKSAIGANMSKAVELLESQNKSNGYFPTSGFHEFYKASISPYGQPYAIYAGMNDFTAIDKPMGNENQKLQIESDVKAGELPLKGTAKRELGGTAVFFSDKMIGALNIFETRYFLMVNGDFERAIITLEDKYKPDTAIPLDVRLGRKPAIKGYFDDGVPVIDIALNIEADIGAIQSRINYESVDKIGELNEMLEKHIEDGVRKTIEKTQKMGSDIFAFGYYMADKFLTIQEWEKYDWNKKYKDARINVKVDANVRRSGLMFEAFTVGK